MTILGRGNWVFGTRNNGETEQKRLSIPALMQQIQSTLQPVYMQTSNHSYTKLNMR